MHRLAFLMTATTLPVFAQIAFRPNVPKVWDDEALRSVELPLAAKISVRHAGSDFYYKIPVRPNVKTYPIYGPGREPKGYWDWLRQQEPQPAFDPAALRTKEDWIKAGEAIFESPKDFNPYDDPFTDVRNPKWYEYTGMPLDKNGIVPFYRYVIRKKGTVEVNLVPARNVTRG